MSLRSSSQQPPGIYSMSNAIGSNHESNASSRICNLRAVPLGQVADCEECHNAKKLQKYGRISFTVTDATFDFNQRF